MRYAGLLGTRPWHRSSRPADRLETMLIGRASPLGDELTHPSLPILRTRHLVSGYPRKKGRATKVDAATRVNSNEAEVIYTRRLLDTICSYCMLRTELF